MLHAACWNAANNIRHQESETLVICACRRLLVELFGFVESVARISDFVDETTLRKAPQLPLEPKQQIPVRLAKARAARISLEI